MREIKFRAWDEDSKFMVEPDFINNNGYACFSNWRGTAILSKDVMQCTGLKDKNGKEIYEGDICLVHDLEKEVVEVIFRKDTASFEGFLRGIKTFKNPHIELFGSYYEIIGNIYENPELLESKK